MNNNPMFKEKKIEKSSNMFITLVVKEIDNVKYEDYYLNMKDMCNMKNISLLVREYNSKQYEEDCEQITKLPAFHLYRDEEWITTFYPNNNILKILEHIENQPKVVNNNWKNLLYRLFRLKK